MKVYSNNINKGELDKAMGKLGSDNYKDVMPARSFHLVWEDLPENTESLALIFIDHDAIPVCGFPWIHWTVANIDPKKGALKENESVEGELLEGVNSWVSKLLPENFRLTHEEATAYGGCAPPDASHTYGITLFALSQKLDLKPGFFMNELLDAMRGKMLAKAGLQVVYQHR